MKLMICGSMHFSKEMLEAKAKIEKLGHKVRVPSDVKECLDNPDLNMDLEYCMRTNIDKQDFDQVAKSDGIVVLNYDKNGIKGYIGGATLMEIGLARHLNKKIFLLQDPPDEKELKYALEVKVARPVILNGDLTRIS
ncbi:MAG: hypothetical protein A2365_02555 [Candidatus Nealsonbacteria bacterium RIFOXYB1_FULL_40_15]|uniref:Maf-like protein n=2 Tax=Candidatus Nealsoniibacteriota TaxID=1817911 RepID=A0A1G2ERV2_9BACT|nr:MAG: hypothetical protein A2365_02555 [Candidatus Nealsonbacteria bacterium RIFOXYB1_FULL_40_15]OGZ28503.1 MAG: hypothetical protein A2427_02210 [Candidatus Nealsonbacteria bacterium RIFOXYC1_FULL_40_7]OGZ28972.1 MAG: hypothetical protein A2562_03195 [Candidatus Nealsonbacteria bacterium RIFOXYD1_FULL_39_11]